MSDTIATYRPEGRGQRVLERLALGPAGLIDLAGVMPEATNRARRRGLWYLLQNMALHDLVAVEDMRYVITPDGRETLAELRRGEHVPVLGYTSTPNVRLFTRP